MYVSPIEKILVNTFTLFESVIIAVYNHTVGLRSDKTMGHARVNPHHKIPENNPCKAKIEDYRLLVALLHAEDTSFYTEASVYATSLCGQIQLELARRRGAMSPQAHKAIYERAQRLPRN